MEKDEKLGSDVKGRVSAPEVQPGSMAAEWGSTCPRWALHGHDR